MNRTCYLRYIAMIGMLLLQELTAQGQLKLGSNPANINKSSVLELESNVQGLLLPRIPDTSAATLTTAPDGMIIFFTPDKNLMVRKNGYWRRVADTANFRSLLLTSGWAQGGNAVSSIQSLGTTSNFGLPLITNNVERMRITETGDVGIGVTVPSTKLHVQATNPLTLLGVQNGTSTTADSLLTITSGLVRKLPMSTFASGAGFWSITGNSGLNGGVNFLGTTDNISLRFRTNNVERLYIDSAFGYVGIGTSVPSTIMHIKTGTANDGGLRMENLTTASSITSGAAYLGVDANGKVVRNNTQPIIYSGNPGGIATADAVTKVWIAEVTNAPVSGTQIITFPTNISFSEILNIQVTAKGGTGIADAPIATVVSNTLTSMVIRVVDGATVVALGQALEVHTSGATKIYIRVEGN